MTKYELDSPIRWMGTLLLRKKKRKKERKKERCFTKLALQVSEHHAFKCGFRTPIRFSG